ncbi:MAG: hypothetical protein PSV24_13805 [Rhodoferax sp.]|nr:hypothetical protein [Rhodoferax sp.]
MASVLVAADGVLIDSVVLIWFARGNDKHFSAIKGLKLQVFRV